VETKPWGTTSSFNYLGILTVFTYLTCSKQYIDELKLIAIFVHFSFSGNSERTASFTLRLYSLMPIYGHPEFPFPLEHLAYPVETSLSFEQVPDKQRL